MLFNSIDFIIFFPIVVLIYFVLPTKIRQYWLLVSSYYFYMCWNAKYALLIFLSTLITYISGLLLERIKRSDRVDDSKARMKKLVVAGSFVFNLTILIYFKYFNFFFSLLGTALHFVHIDLQIPQFDIVLPVGISFYTFQALSYTMDVYRDEIYAEKNFFRYALFVSFFPQLVAGPIERSKNLLRQLAVPQKFSYDNFREGILLMIWGYFLKIVIADRIAVFVDTVYGDVASYPGYYIAFATVIFAVQIYCDFYGYSSIAMGAAKVLGISLMENFDAPFLATSVADLWRRWHISLTSWFRDYLYIPLGGSRRGKVRKYVNIFIVFMVSGLWHGASIAYMIWGVLNAIYQIIGDLLRPIRQKAIRMMALDTNAVGYKIIHRIVTFLLFAFSFLFFRAGSTSEAIAALRQLFPLNNPWVLVDSSLYNCGLDAKNFWLAMICIAVLLFADICKEKKIVIRNVIMRQDGWCRCLIIAVSVVFILLFGIWGPTFDKASFIYFQF